MSNKQFDLFSNIDDLTFKEGDSNNDITNSKPRQNRHEGNIRSNRSNDLPKFERGNQPELPIANVLMDSIAPLGNHSSNFTPEAEAFIIDNETSQPSDVGIANSGDSRIRTSDEERPDSNGDIEPQRNKTIHLSDYIIQSENIINNERTKFEKNFLALKTLKEIGDGTATEAQQKTLSEYSGWGGLPQVFDETNEKWEEQRAQLKSLITDTEYKDAMSSTQNSHYTPKLIIDTIYSSLNQMGFNNFDQKKEILEPSVGTGAFLGFKPENINANYTTIELDPLSHRITELLYPLQDNVQTGFEKAFLTPKFDAVIGNPPFGSKKIFDAADQDINGLSIHNYFIAKSIKNLKEDGVAAFVVSSYFLDGKNDETRKLISEQASFLGAVRLPNDAFKNAGTQVTTDIVFFKKGKNLELDKSWIETKETDVSKNENDNFSINEYFTKHPENILGELKKESNQFGFSLECSSDGRNLEKSLQDFVSSLPKDAYKHNDYVKKNEVFEIEKSDPIIKDYKVGNYFIHEKKICYRLPDALVKAQYIECNLTKLDANRIKKFISIRKHLNQIIQAEKNPNTTDSSLETMRDNLNASYDHFLMTEGHLNKANNKKLFRDDTEAQKVLSLEKNYNQGISVAVAKKNDVDPIAPSAIKADIFQQRIINPHTTFKIENSQEALIASSNEFGRVNLNWMAESLGKPKEEVINELKDLIFLNHKTNTYELAEKYLSGNVKEKYNEVLEIIKNNPEYEENLKALKTVQPEDIDPIDIGLQMGSTWIPSKYYKEFVDKTLSVDSKIDYDEKLGTWRVDIPNEYNPTQTVDYGTERILAADIAEAIFKDKLISVYDQEVNPKAGQIRVNKKGQQYNEPANISVLNIDETTAANSKAEKLKQEFKDWIWEDPQRREDLARLYNDRFNTHVAPTYNGSELKMPNMSNQITLRKHQKDAIMRGIQEGTCLFDHVVGAGKTMVAIGTIMESKRMGLINKPMVVVPNHLTSQWQDDFYKMYPDANILVASKKDLKPDTREQFFAKIATNRYDAVIMAHSQFKLISAPFETIEKLMQKEIDTLLDAVDQNSNATGKKVSVKKLQERIDNRKSALNELLQTHKKSRSMDFSDLGVDALIVDEAHEYKNLNIVTAMNGVAGLGNLTGSQKAFDLFCKTRYLQEKNDKKGVYLLTGTPISNSISEMYTIQRYMQFEVLESKRIAHFDAWAKTFGQVGHGWELDSSGVNYKTVSRFNKFQNVPELINMYQTFADVVTNKDIEKYTANFIPKPMGGKPINRITPRSPEVEEYIGYEVKTGRVNDKGEPIYEYNVGSIIWRMENFKEDPRRNNMLACTTDARKAGLDYRLIDPTATDILDTKVNQLVNDVYETAMQWKEDKGTQLIFCDMSTPKTHSQSKKKIEEKQIEETIQDDDTIQLSNDELEAKNSKFDVYNDILEKLVAKGMDRSEIRFVHDSTTALQESKLFQDVRDGTVRVLIGSTQKMGAGTNVQNRLVAINHLDCPWQPKDLEQRNGRAYRQGNILFLRDPENFRITERRYAQEQTYDARMWQVIESKALAIEQLRKGGNLRVIDDISSDAANAAEMKASATGNPLIFMQVQLANNLKKEEALYSNHKKGIHRVQEDIKTLRNSIDEHLPKKALLNELIKHKDKNTKEVFEFTIDNHIYKIDTNGPTYKEQNDTFKKRLSHSLMSVITSQQHKDLGEYKGFKVGCSFHKTFSSEKGMKAELQFHLSSPNHSFEIKPQNLRYEIEEKFSFSKNGFIQRLDNALDFSKEIEKTDQNNIKNLATLDALQKRQETVYPNLPYLNALREDNIQVINELKSCQRDKTYKSNFTPSSESIPEFKEKTAINEILSDKENSRINEEAKPDFLKRPITNEAKLEATEDKASSGSTIANEAKLEATEDKASSGSTIANEAKLEATEDKASSGSTIANEAKLEATEDKASSGSTIANEAKLEATEDKASSGSTIPNETKSKENETISQLFKYITENDDGKRLISKINYNFSDNETQQDFSKIYSMFRALNRQDVADKEFFNKYDDSINKLHHDFKNINNINSITKDSSVAINIINSFNHIKEIDHLNDSNNQRIAIGTIYKAGGFENNDIDLYKTVEIYKKLSSIENKTEPKILVEKLKKYDIQAINSQSEQTYKGTFISPNVLKTADNTLVRVSDFNIQNIGKNATCKNSTTTIQNSNENKYLTK